MDLINKNSLTNRKIRFHFLWNLVFSFLLIGCTERKKEITIQWKNEKAEAVNIPLGLFPDIRSDSIVKHLQVRLINNSASVIHDDISVNNGSVTFKPLISFTHGLEYEIVFSNKIIGQFKIPPLSKENPTEVVSVYPTADTLPENALKLYIVFSKPMQEGLALQNISFIKNDNDTLSSIFPDLTHELWNNERTALTLWFDPGRIKRDLQPNENLGSPLQQNNRYKIIINKDWRDDRGLALKSSYEKNFAVGKRDGVAPDPATWHVNQPKALTRESLSIDLQESLDYLLLKNTVAITDSKGITINGSFEPTSKEQILAFTPTEAWKPGEYIIKIEARLEDLAGNNLNRLFDKDLTQPNKNEQQAIFIKKFRVD